MIRFNNEQKYLNINDMDYSEENIFDINSFNNYNKRILDKRREDMSEFIFPFNSISPEFEEFKEYMNDIKTKEERDNNKNNSKEKRNEIKLQTNFINNINPTVKKLLGRKRKGSNEKRNHNNCSYDNLLRKIKHVLLEAFRVLVNNRINKIYKISKEKSMELVKINQAQANNIKIDFNQLFNQKKLKEIFSDKTTTKNHCERDHNKKLIEKLLNEEDINKRKIFEKLFNYKFIDLIKYTRNQRDGLDELEGLIFPKTFYESLENDKEYAIKFNHTLNNYEKLLGEKKSRNRKKNLNYFKCQCIKLSKFQK